MARCEIAFPLELDADYPCRGRDANGKETHFNDLLSVGEIVASVMVGDDLFGPYGRVVERDGGLWVDAAPDYDEKLRTEQLAALSDSEQGED